MPPEQLVLKVLLAVEVDLGLADFLAALGSQAILALAAQTARKVLQAAQVPLGRLERLAQLVCSVLSV